MVHYHKQECLKEKLDCYIQGQGHCKFQNVNECLPRWYLLNPELFTTKLGMVMHHYEPDSLSKRLLCFLQCQGHNEGSYNQNMTF